MQWSNNEHHIVIVALHRASKSTGDIFSLLKNISISCLLVYRAIELYQETGDVVDWEQTGHPPSVQNAKTDQCCLCKGSTQSSIQTEDPLAGNESF